MAKGVAAGLLVAFIPIPAQLILSALLALLLRANLPIAIVSTLISNPFTFVPINLLIYHIGTLLTGGNGAATPPPIHELELHWGNIGLIWQEAAAWFQSLGKNYVIGLLVLSTTASLGGFASSTSFGAFLFGLSCAHEKIKPPANGSQWWLTEPSSK